MRTKSFLIVAVIVAMLCVFGRTASAQIGWKIGVVGGEDFAGAATLPSPFSGSTAQGTSGYLLGLRSDKDLLLGLSIITEIDITQRSFQDDITVPSGSGNSVSSAESWREKIQDMDIPILLKFSPFGGSIQPYVYAGPDLSILLSASTVEQTATSSQTNDQSALFNSINVNIDGGFGLQFQLSGFMWIFAEGRYTFGLTNAYNSVHDASLGNLNARDVKWVAGLMIGF